MRQPLISSPAARLSLLLTAVASLLFGLFVCGCVKALRPSNVPSQEKVRLLSPEPENYSVVVAENVNYAIGADGKVQLSTPVLDRGCATYLFGLKLKDASPNDVQFIHIKKGDRTIRKLSLNDLAKLPADKEGYRMLNVK